MTPLPEPASIADIYALQALEGLQEAAKFVCTMTGRQMLRTKWHYDTTVKPRRFEEGEEVLLIIHKRKESNIIIDFPSLGITYNGGWCSATMTR